MLNKFKAHLSRFKPSTAIVGALIGILAISGVALLLTRNNSKTEAAVQPLAARIDQVDGNNADSSGISRRPDSLNDNR